MPQIAEWFFKTAVVFFIIGILMGLQMSITGEYNITAAHAHTNLLGWVTGALFGSYYALNPRKAENRLARIHFWSHIVPLAAMTPSLYLVSYGYSVLEPVLAVSALAALASVLLFTVIVYSSADAMSARRAVPAE